MALESSREKSSFYRFDPLAKLMIAKFYLSPLRLGLLSIAISIISIGVYLLSAWLNHRLEFISERSSLIKQWIPLILAVLLVNPVILGYYLWSFQAIDNVIQELESSKVLNDSQSDIKSIFRNEYGKKWRIFLAFIIALITSFYIFHQGNWEEKHHGSVPLPPLFIAIPTFVVVYAGSTLILNLIANIRILHHILKEKKLNVKPLHPDRCGGLRSLSDYSLKTAYPIAVLGVWIGVLQYQIFTEGWPSSLIFIIFPLYILISVTVFFGPLLTAHHGMRKAKEDLLHQIAQWFDTEYSKIYEPLSKDIDDDLKKRTERLQNFRLFYTMTDEFPVWPFDTSIIRRYLLTTFTAFVPIIFNLLKKLIVVLLEKFGRGHILTH